MFNWELFRCINVYTNHPAEAIWGAEDLGTILEYLAPRWRYSAYRRESNPGIVKLKTRDSEPRNQRRQRWVYHPTDTAKRVPLYIPQYQTKTPRQRVFACVASDSSASKWNLAFLMISHQLIWFQYLLKIKRTWRFMKQSPSMPMENLCSAQSRPGQP